MRSPIHWRSVRLLLFAVAIALPTIGSPCFKEKTASIPTPTAYSVLVSVVGNGSVTISPTSPNNLWEEGATITLTATGQASEFFMGWSGDANGFVNPATVTVTRDLAITATFEPLNGRPQSQFTMNPSPAEGTPPLAVSFTDTSTATPTAWEWDFGDGNSSTQQNPTHNFASTGAYTITLRAANGNGTGAPVTVAQAVLVIDPFVGSPYWFVGGNPANGYVEHTTSEQAWADEVLNLTNQLRAGQGVAPLQWDADAYRAAKAHCEDMRGRGYFAHNTPEGWSPGDRLQMTGASGYSGWGENIAVGYTSPQAVVTAWRNSPGHWNNMKNPTFTHLGVGVSQAGFYWAQVFLRR